MGQTTRMHSGQGSGGGSGEGDRSSEDAHEISPERQKAIQTLVVEVIYNHKKETQHKNHMKENKMNDVEWDKFERDFRKEYCEARSKVKAAFRNNQIRKRLKELEKLFKA